MNINNIIIIATVIIGGGGLIVAIWSLINTKPKVLRIPYKFESPANRPRPTKTPRKKPITVTMECGCSCNNIPKRPWLKKEAKLKN